MLNKGCVFGILVMGLVALTLTGCGTLDSKKNQLEQQENFASKNKMQDKANPSGWENDAGKIEPTSTRSQNETDEGGSAPLVIITEKIHEGYPVYQFKVYGEKDDIFLSVNKIRIFEESKGELVQEIEVKDVSIPNSIDNAGVELVDANFDGYKDLQIQSGMGAGPNVFYNFWLWDKDSSQYIQSEELSSLTSTKIDSENKTITSENSSQAGAYYIESVYIFVDGKLTLIKETERIADTEKKLFNYTVKELVGNDMKVTKQYSEPFE